MMNATQVKKRILRSRWSVKGVKLMPGHDEYAKAMSCSLYKSGKRVATVYDDSYGGGLQYHWLAQEHEQEFTDYCRRLTDISHTDNWIVDYDEDIVVVIMINHYQEDRQFKRLCKNKTLVKLQGDDDGEYQSFNCKYDKTIGIELRKKYGEDLVEIINERYI